MLCSSAFNLLDLCFIYLFLLPHTSCEHSQLSQYHLDFLFLISHLIVILFILYSCILDIWRIRMHHVSHFMAWVNKSIFMSVQFLWHLFIGIYPWQIYSLCAYKLFNIRTWAFYKINRMLSLKHEVHNTLNYFTRYLYIYVIYIYILNYWYIGW